MSFIVIKHNDVWDGKQLRVQTESSNRIYDEQSFKDLNMKCNANCPVTSTITDRMHKSLNGYHYYVGYDEDTWHIHGYNKIASTLIGEDVYNDVIIYKFKNWSYDWHSIKGLTHIHILEWDRIKEIAHELYLDEYDPDDEYGAC